MCCAACFAAEGWRVVLQDAAKRKVEFQLVSAEILRGKSHAVSAKVSLLAEPRAKREFKKGRAFAWAVIERTTIVSGRPQVLASTTMKGAKVISVTRGQRNTDPLVVKLEGATP